MNNFTFYNPAKIIFGRDIESGIGAEVKKYSPNILLHYGGGSIKQNGVYDKVMASLLDAGITVTELPGVKPNPRLALVHEGIELCKKNGIDFVLAVGGGSAIDSAKAIALGVPDNGEVWDFYAGKRKPEKALPIGTVLTIPAAGSESSSGSVITNENGLVKTGFVSELIIPKFSFLNPETTMSLPPYQVSCGATDIIAHLLERYFTNVTHVDYTDRLIEASLRTMIHNTRLVLKDLKNYDYRAEMMWCGTLAHNNLMDTGRIGDWASHDMEHQLSAFYDIAHGAGLAIIFPAWMKYVWRHDPERFVQYAVRVMHVEAPFADKETIITEGIAKFENFLRAIGMPVRMSELGITGERIPEMATKARFGQTTLGQFVKLTQDDIEAIYRLAL